MEEQREDDALFTLQDLGPLRKMIEEVSPVLIVLDPVMNFLGEKTDAHRDNEVRPLLSRLMMLAELSQVTILGIRHLRKAATGTAVYAAGGSVAFSGAARSVLIAARYERDDGSDTHIVAHAKTSDTPTGASLAYAISSDGKDELGFWNTKFERQYAQFVLDETGGVVFKAAELAGKERKDFYTLCHRAGVTPADHRHA
jgi:DNA-binding NtrC family response regulator